MDTALTERCAVCDQLLYQCVCGKPEQSLAEWLSYGRGRGWVSPIVCDQHNGLLLTDEEATALNNGDDICIFAMRFYAPTPERTPQ